MILCHSLYIPYRYYRNQQKTELKFSPSQPQACQHIIRICERIDSLKIYSSIYDIVCSFNSTRRTGHTKQAVFIFSVCLVFTLQPLHFQDLFIFSENVFCMFYEVKVKNFNYAINDSLLRTVTLHGTFDICTTNYLWIFQSFAQCKNILRFIN